MGSDALQIIGEGTLRKVLKLYGEELFKYAKEIPLEVDCAEFTKKTIEEIESRGQQKCVAQGYRDDLLELILVKQDKYDEKNGAIL